MRKRTFKKIVVLLMIFCMTAVYMPVFSFAEELSATQEVSTEVQNPTETVTEPSVETPPDTPAAKDVSEPKPEAPKQESPSEKKEEKKEKKVVTKSAPDKTEELNVRNYDGDPDTELENPTGAKDLDWDKLLSMKEEKIKQDKARRHTMHTKATMRGKYKAAYKYRDSDKKGGMTQFTLKLNGHTYKGTCSTMGIPHETGSYHNCDVNEIVRDTAFLKALYVCIQRGYYDGDKADNRIFSYAKLHYCSAVQAMCQMKHMGRSSWNNAASQWYSPELRRDLEDWVDEMYDIGSRTVTDADIENLTCYNVLPDKDGVQDGIVWTLDSDAYACVQKSPRNTAVAAPADSSLAGAVYWVFEDAELTDRATDDAGNAIVLTTGANGRTNIAELTANDVYYIVETTPSPGYILDPDMTAPRYKMVKPTSANNRDNPAVVTSYEPYETGYVCLQKSEKTSNVDFHNTAPTNYSLAGAVYELYTNQECTARATDIAGNPLSLTTDVNGRTNTVEVLTVPYWAKEVTASPGYKLDTNITPVTVTAANTSTNPATFQSDEPPTMGRMMQLRKEDTTGEVGWRKLLGAEYTLRYYNVAPSTEDVTGLTPTRSWTFKTVEKTNDEGRKYAGIDFATDSPIAGDAFYEVKARMDGDLVVLDDTKPLMRIMPIGVFAIEETKAPQGLSRNETVYYGSVTQKTNAADAVTEIRGVEGFDINVATGEIDNDEEPQSVKLVINKHMAKEGVTPSSLSSLAGAKYEVYFNDPTASLPELVGYIETDENGYGEITKRSKGKETMIGQDLRPGDYLIKEIIPSPGYFIDKYILAENGSTVEVKDGAIEVIRKYDKNGTPVTDTIHGTYEDGKHLFRAYVEADGSSVFTFTVDSKETPTETHIKKTDATTTKELPGAKLQILKDNEIIEEWVSTEKEHIVYGLPVGTYTLREITAPYGYDIAEDIEFTVSDTEIMNKVEMKNKPIEIGTTAKDAETGTHQGAKKENETIVDTVKLSGLVAGRKYQLTGKLWNKQTSEFVKNAEGETLIVKSEEFVATGSEMSVDMTFTVDTSGFDNDASLVACEYLTRVERIDGRDETSDFPEEDFPKELAKHTDLNDDDQTIHYGGIVGTTAVDAKNGTHNILAGKNVVIKDTVAYKNLSTKDTYTITGELYDKTTGQLTGIKATTPFKPEKPDGTVVVEFKFDASKLKGHTLVAYEILLLNNIEINRHEDPNDKDQTIYVPKIGTLAGKPKKGKVVDVVAYKNLIPGQKYVVRGYFVKKSDGKKIKGSNGSATFKPTSANGRTAVTLKTAGKSGKLVAFESLYVVDSKGKEHLVAVHKDLNDEDQTVVVKAKKTPKTGEDYLIFYLGGALILAASGYIVFRRRITNK